MFDGTKINYTLKDFEAWKQLVNNCLNSQFQLTIFEDTGELPTKKRVETITTTHRAKWETFDLIVKEVLNTTTGKTVFHLTIIGSLHKNHFAGNNYKPFTWQQLQQQINHICKTLHLNPSKAQILTLELGVNMVTPFEVKPFVTLQNFILHKSERFNNYSKDKKRRCLGIHCDDHSKYRVKVYNKGLQNLLPYELLRFEIKFTCMEKLKPFAIKYLSDLQQQPKVKGLLPMVIQAWQDVLLFDASIDLNSPLLKPKESKLLLEGSNPTYWEQLKQKVSNSTYHERVTQFKNMVATFGNNRQQQVKELIQKEWEELFKKNRTNCTSGKPKAKTQKPDKLHIKIKVQYVRTRVCQSCGNDITHQRKGSKFCSPKSVGEAAAHQCRNNSNNPRNNRKNKIKKITGRGILFSIVPFIAKGKKTKYFGIDRAGKLLMERNSSQPRANKQTKGKGMEGNGLLF